jgi:formylglycine-generating enzyme required for sulfatase activity
LLLSLGEFSDLSADARKAMLPKVQEMYRTEADPGLHAASEWLLRAWNQDAWLRETNNAWAKNKDRLAGIEQALAKEKKPQWYVNTQGQTFVVIPGPVTFVMGSQAVEKDHENDEVEHKRRIGHSFEIASKPVTLAEYRRLTKDKYESAEKYTHSPDLPVVGINWYMAARYCNLLSKEEGIDEEQWCYETDGRDAVTKLKEGFRGLTGYRLPTEAEMEHATRAEAVTSRYYGETEELLANYAWYQKNSNGLLQRVGLKKPNDLGLFDVQGNCFTWCSEAYDAYPKAEGEKAVEDKEVPKDAPVVKSTVGRVLRGGSFINQPSNVRSANRFSNVPTYRFLNYGFRPARTFAP